MDDYRGKQITNVSFYIDFTCLMIRVEKNHDFFYLNQIFFNLIYRHLYIYVYICKLFQMCSIQIDLGSCLNRGYMIFVYIKTLDNVHKASVA